MRHDTSRYRYLVLAEGHFGPLSSKTATSAVRYLAKEWGAEPFASLDPEPYFDFQAHRPDVRLTEEGIREVVWPSTEFTHAEIPGADHNDRALLDGSDYLDAVDEFLRRVAADR
jgi:hypothetical protein